MKDLEQLGVDTFFEIEGVDVPILCSEGHDLKVDGAVRIEECRFTGRKRWRCKRCAKDASAISRKERTNRAKVIEEAIDDEILARLTRISKKSRDITTQDIVRLIVTHAVEKLEETIQNNAAPKRGKKGN